MPEEIDVIDNKAGQPARRLLQNGRLVDFRGKSIGFAALFAQS